MPRRVVIIGGGVIGLCAAWFARQRGWDVTVIDRNAPVRDGCSFGNAGMIVPSHVVPLAAPGMVWQGLKWMRDPQSPFYIRPRLSWDLLTWGYRFWRAATAEHVTRAAPVLRDLHIGSRALYADFAANWGNEFGLVQRGLLMLCRTAHGLDEEARGAMMASRLGIPVEVLDRAGVASHDPDVTMDVVGGVLFPQDCHLSPQQFMAGLQRRLSDQGCRFLWETEVQPPRLEQGRWNVVRTAAEELPADQVLLAGGAWSPLLSRGLNLKLPMQAGKGYSLTLREPRQLPQLCSIGVEGRIAITPMGTSLRVGGTMELSGTNDRIEPQRVQGIVRSFCHYFPRFQPEDFAGITPWFGLRPCSPDGLPYVGRTNRCANLILATGHAMMGLSLGPITGKLTGELLDGEPPSLDLAMLSPDRY
jgi:D-amino-acid dehydrogenase